LDTRGFVLRRSDIRGNCFIPRYYDPQVASDIDGLRRTHDVRSIGEMVESEEISVSTGDEIGKMAYGTGPIPFVRTSDIANLEIKTDAKQGVSQSIYEQYCRKQDVREDDLLFVRDGTYLVGAVAPVGPDDLPMLFQSHLLKFRVNPGSQIDSHLLLALLLSPIVRRQVRAKQFTADIIDTIGNRYLEIELPIPRDSKKCAAVSTAIGDLLDRRRRQKQALQNLPLECQGKRVSARGASPVVETQGADEAKRKLGFLQKASAIRHNTWIPRYYNPATRESLRELAKTHELVTIGSLVEEGVIDVATGVEPGKMSYGTGVIPFIRTSDFANWELVTNPKQLVSEATFETYRRKADAKASDIFVVRDGTYLVGASCILTDHDVPVLFAGGLYRIRVLDHERLDPFLLFVLLNAPIVKRQVRDKQFTRDIIDTVGKRFFEIELPLPRDTELARRLAVQAREAVEERAALRERARSLAAKIALPPPKAPNTRLGANLGA
jgi:hypothetical protein